MQKAVYLLLIGFALSLTSCRKDFDTVPSSGNLEFSKQTVYLDTIFTDIGSSTYMLKVYNRSNKDITIPSIHLGKADSKYRIMVDGMTGIDADNSGQGDGRVFPNVELLAKDSLFIFIETTVNIAEENLTDFLYTDEIQFESVNGTQKVNLVTLVQDAVFLYPEKYNDGTRESLLLGLDDQGNQVRVNGFELNDNDPLHGNEFHFTNQKPYVIYGYAGIPNNKELVIDAGARVNFHADSGLIVQPGGKLTIKGEPSPDLLPMQNEVFFEGDRLEPDFSDTPGQWGTVWLRQGSTSNIKHLTLKNATVGLLVDRATLDIKNSQIYNSTNVGILATTATIYSENLVVNLAGQACLAVVSGGDYQFKHGTFNNNWGTPNQVCVSLSNYDLDANQIRVNKQPLTQAYFHNCIIYGSNNIELLLTKDDSVAFDTTGFKNCLVKFREAGTGIEGSALYDFLRPPLTPGNGNKINEDPKFLNANYNRLNIEDNSPAHNAGEVLGISFDVLGKQRTSIPPDIGAYQSAPFPP